MRGYPFAFFFFLFEAVRCHLLSLDLTLYSWQKQDDETLSLLAFRLSSGCFFSLSEVP